jgi:hypothetical protein
VHGLAGPSGVLAVLPGVVLADASASASYLVAFFLASTASMGAFAALFGAATHGATRRAAAAEATRDDRDEESGLSKGGAEASEGSAGQEETEADARATRERVSDRATRLAMALNLFAACAALAIGALWLALSSLGLLGSL